MAGDSPDKPSALGLLVERFLDNVENAFESASFRLQLLFLQRFTSEDILTHLATYGINGPAVWVADVVSTAADIIAQLPGALRRAFTQAMLETVAGLLLDEPGDKTVVMTRQTALDACKRLLTQETAILITGGVTTRWRIVARLRKVGSGMFNLFKVLGWGQMLEKAILILVDFWAAAWDVFVKFVAAAMLIHLSDPEVKDRLFPTLTQSNPKGPAKTKVWTRERGNQKR